jgi:hypothetical protein
MPVSFKSKTFIFVCLLVLAGSLRFYKLGDWPFAGDELATINEEKAFYEGEEIPPESQVYRLPRIIPLSYFFHHVGDTLFGRDEFGSRVLMAVFGTLTVGLVFWLLDSLKGRSTAIAAALLMALWPEHVFHSQVTRYYIVVAFFAGIALLAGAFVAQRRSTWSAILVCCAILAAILCHILISILVGIILIGIVAGTYAERQPLPKNVIAVFLLTGILVAIFGVFYLKPLVSGWNSGAAWGYGVMHSILASIYALGWSVALLAALGFVLLMRDRNAQNWYWITCALGWAAATAALPLIVVYNPAYVFPLAIPIFVLAGCAVGTIYDCLRTKGALVGALWIGLICLCELPSLASHYVDGSRYDIRTAAQYVKKNWRNGDQVTGFTMGGFKHYAEGCEPAIPLPSDAVRRLQEIVLHHNRLWVLLPSCRGGLPADLERYLGTHCSHELKVQRKRFDYSEYTFDVFLYTPPAERGKTTVPAGGQAGPMR